MKPIYNQWVKVHFLNFQWVVRVVIDTVICCWNYLMHSHHLNGGMLYQ